MGCVCDSVSVSVCMWCGVRVMCSVLRAYA